MVRFLELAYEAIASTLSQAWAWLSDVVAAGGLDVRNWQPLTWVLVVAAVLLLIGLLWRLRPARKSAAPDLMVSHGMIALQGEGDGSFEADELAVAGLAAPARALHHLSLTLSNLNAYPLQLLELAVRTRGARLPVVAEAGSVVPPHGAVDVTAELFDLPGDAGVIDLFLYSGGNKRRIWRLSAPLEWEPWTQSFRVKALAARVVGVGRLASQERRQHERRAFRGARRRQRQRQLTEGAYRRAEALKEQVTQRRAEAEQRAVQRAAEQRAAAQQAAAQQAAAQQAAAQQRDLAAVEDGSSGQPRPPMVGADGWTAPQSIDARAGQGDPQQRDRSARRWPGPSERATTATAVRPEAPAEQLEAHEEAEMPVPKARLEFPDEF